MIEIIRPGKDITVNGQDATVLGVWLDGLEVKYQVAMWNGAERKVCWIHAHEVDGDVPGKLKIGFKNDG